MLVKWHYYLTYKISLSNGIEKSIPFSYSKFVYRQRILAYFMKEGLTMHTKETKRLVYGAMMLAHYGILLVIDTYTGAFFNIFLYYLMPLPFVVYGLKYGFQMLLVLLFAAVCLGFLIALPSTVFLSLSAMLVSVVLYWGISQKKNSSVIFFATMLVTSMAQLLSMTVFASLLGYDIAEDLALLQQYVPLSSQEVLDYALPLFVVIIGSMEAFIMMTFTDVLLFRLKMEKMVKFSLFTIHLSKKTGYLILGLISLAVLSNQPLIRGLGILAFLLAMVQGLSLILYYHVLKGHSRLMHILSLVGCIVPGVNIFYAVLGLFDIFSEIRQKLLYNRCKS